MRHGKRLTTEAYIEKAVKKHGNTYDYSETKYVYSMEPVTIICKIHGSFSMVASTHLSGKGCYKCGRDAQKSNTNDFVAKAIARYGSERFDYSETEYTTNRTKVAIRCYKHGVFNILPCNHLKGNGGCKRCSGNEKLTTDTFIKRAIDLHGNVYDYSKTAYSSARSSVVIICKKHGAFNVIAAEHLKGKGRGGCKYCSRENRKYTTEVFIEKAIHKHGNAYDYSLVNYIFGSKKVKIICKKHGIFEQLPSMHLFGNGCPNCTFRVSKAETAWLDSLGVRSDYRQTNLLMKSGKRYLVDAYVPETNTVYEFNGDYWHGNPKKHKAEEINEMNGIAFGILFENTQSKIKELIENGYNVVSIWESDFTN
jgi:hypothetical protein